MVKRYRFVDWFGFQCGLEDTDDLEEAKKLAIEFQCEVIDRQGSLDGKTSTPVFNCWSGELKV